MIDLRLLFLSRPSSEGNENSASHSMEAACRQLAELGAALADLVVLLAMIVNCVGSLIKRLSSSF